MSKTILCFGDSNTWGFIPGSEGDRYAPDVRWPGILKASLGEGFTIIEEAQNGRMTAWDDPFERPASRNAGSITCLWFWSHKSRLIL